MNFCLEVGRARLELSTVWREEPDVKKFPIKFQTQRGSIGGSNIKIGYISLTVRRQQLSIALPHIQPWPFHWPPLPWR